MKITRKELKELIKEQVGLMVPPGSNMEESSLNEGKSTFGMDLRVISFQVYNAAQKYLLKIFLENSNEPQWMGFLFDDVVKMVEIRNALFEDDLNLALKLYRACDASFKNEFPPSMSQLSMLEKKARKEKIP